VLKPDQNMRYADSDSESECSGLNTEYKDKEIEKANTKQFNSGSSHNTRVVQSPCTLMYFTVITQD